jgi:PAS domain S-box-containing protein
MQGKGHRATSTTRSRLPPPSPGTQPSPHRFAAVLYSISEGVVAVDRDWRITCFNRAAEEITGYRRAEVLGRFCYEILRSDLCRDACPIRRTIETGEPTAGLVVHIQDRDGQKVPVSLSTAIYQDEEGRLLGGVETFRDLRQIEALKKKAHRIHSSEDIVTRNPRLGGIVDILPVISESDSTVLLTGETGTGKELFARTIHNLSSRRSGPFIAVNCACFPQTLVESELFGYERGAFTGATRSKPGRFARAQGGTLFLDEIGSLPPPTQAKLLRVLQNKTYEPLGGTKTVKANIRLLTATNQDLNGMVAEGAFRRDLYYRINVIQLDLPPLRERPEDLLPLVRHFISELGLLHGNTVGGLTPEALQLILDHDFPGNVRELENILEHVFVLSPGPLIDVEHLPEWLTPRRPAAGKARSLADCERTTLVSALQKHGWDRSAAAAELGMHRSTLYRKVKRLGIRLSPPENPSTGSPSTSR